MSETPRSPPSLQSLVVALPGKIFRRDALAIFVTLAVGAGGFALAQEKAKDQIAEVASAKVEPVKKQVAELAVSVEDLRKQLAAKEARDAERWDSLYRLLAFGQRSPRAAELAQPTTDTRDGGAP